MFAVGQMWLVEVVWVDVDVGLCHHLGKGFVQVVVVVVMTFGGVIGVDFWVAT